MAAKQSNKEVQGNRTTNPWEAIPSWELLNRFLPKVKELFKATLTNYLACLLQVNLFGLRDNLGAIQIRETDGTIFDSDIGDPSHKDWYNKRTGQLYISHFKTENTAMGQPYDFQLPPMLRDAINVTLASSAPQACREYLVNIGVGKPTRKGKAGLPLPVSDKIQRSFRAAGLIYKAQKLGRLVDYTPGILEIGHSQVMFKYREWWKKDRTLTEEQISQKIAGFFNRSSDISRGYKCLTFDSLTDPLATNRGISSSSPQTAPAARPAAPLSPVEKSEDSGETGESGGPSGAAGGQTWGRKGSHSARRARKATPKPPAPPAPAPAIRKSTRARRASARQ